MNNIPDFLVGADNVYRTAKHIVKQVLVYQENDTADNCVMSFDTYYRRTLKRDFAYMMAFKEKDNINGKRMPSTMFHRTYID